VRVLVCDDDRVIRYLLQMVIGRRGGHEVVEVAHPDEVVPAALEKLPDLVLLDFVLPGRSGLDVVEEIRAEPELSAVPIAFLTGRDDVAGDDRYTRLGVAGIIEKPFDSSTLVPRLEALAGR
jgi:DNA-binding response OmpR family regulator